MILLRLFWQIPIGLLLLSTVLVFANEFAVARASRRTKDVAYIQPSQPGFNPERHVLDVYTPKEQASKLHPVVVFIHGGAWNSGSKNLYGFIGRRLAKQGQVAVVINYRLSPEVEVPDMVNDCAHAIAWTVQHIAEYGGDPKHLFVMGHSAGGGIAALLAVDGQYFNRLGLAGNPIKGAILDDPAGVDMYDYLQRMEYPGDEKYLIPFGKKPAVWQAMSALYQVNASCPPMQVYIGGHTYLSIDRSTRKFDQRLTELHIRHEFTVIPDKKHIPMVLQLFWSNNIIYQNLKRLVISL